MVRLRSGKSADGLPIRPAPTTSDPETLSQPNNLRLPAEVISEIISYFVDDGLEISTDPSRESDMATIHALMATNLQVKRETLRQIYSQGLWINIVDGVSCGCAEVTLDKFNVHKVTSIKKILNLPLQKWPGVIVRFVPTGSPRVCDVRRSTYYRSNDPTDIKFDNAIDCIVRQSDNLARFLRFPYHPTQRYSRDPEDQYMEKIFLTTLALRYTPIPVKSRTKPEKCPLNFILFFHGCEETLSANASRNVPLWEWYTVCRLLHHWSWSRIVSNRNQIRLPQLMGAAFVPGRCSVTDPVIQECFPGNPQKLTDHFRHLFWQWWTEGRESDWYPDRRIGLLDVIAERPARSNYRSFPNPPRPLPAPWSWTFQSQGMLRVNVAKEAKNGAELWIGDLLVLKYPPPVPY